METIDFNQVIQENISVVEGLMQKKIVIKSWAELDEYGINAPYDATLQISSPSSFPDFDEKKHPKFSAGAVKIYNAGSDIPIQVIYNSDGAIYNRFYSKTDKQWKQWKKISVDTSFEI